MVEWVLWALFSCGPEDAQESWNDEVDTYVKKVEELTGMKLEDGRTELTTSLRLTLDRVKMSHRPLIWYTVSEYLTFLILALDHTFEDCRLSGYDLFYQTLHFGFRTSFSCKIRTSVPTSLRRLLLQAIRDRTFFLLVQTT